MILFSALTTLQNILLLCSSISLVTYLIFKTKIKKFSFLLLSLLSIFYFGPLSILKLLLVSSLAAYIGQKVFKKNTLIGFLLGIFVAIQFYTIIGLILNPATAQLIVYLLGILSLYPQRKNFNLSLYRSINNHLNSFSLIEIFLVIFAFIISSQPQVHWDAVYANLYNAKRYIETNSFSPLVESISSLFPQNAITYYSFFFEIAKFKGFQIAFILPMIGTILVLKHFLKMVKNSSLFFILSQLLIFSPIFIFQSSTGYYDGIVAFCCLISIYLVLKETSIRNLFVFSFFIGFATAIRYFPLVFGLIPVIYIFIKKIAFTTKLKYLLITLFLLLVPISAWAYRSYQYIGSPTFPFLQNIFPTPDYWPSTSPLENNPMIQTTMKSKEWLQGGFLTYPFKSYLYSEQFLEASTGYPTAIPIILNIFTVLLIINTLIKFIKNHRIDSKEGILIICYFAFIIIGAYSRYYRYLWPYQLMVSTACLFLISNKIKKSYILNFFLLFFFLVNFKNIYNYFNFYPIFPNKLLQPDYYFKNSTDADPIIFLNKTVNKDDQILDASKNNLPRVNLVPRVTECNWYWIKGQDKILNQDTFNSFNYLILSKEKDPTNYCNEAVNKYSLNYSVIYEDKDYIIKKK